MVDSLMASEQQGDIEYTWTFQDLIEKSPLFELGFSPKHIYYQRESNIPKGYTTTVAGTYFKPERTLEYLEEQAINPDRTYIGRNVYREAAQAVKKKEVPEGDFVFMKGFMLPGDKTITYYEDKPELDKSDELSVHMHEFIHRALNTVPQLKEWKEKNNIDKRDEELMMAVFTQKYFPEMLEVEKDRIEGVYGIDITNNYNKNKISNWINEVEKISKDILKETTPPSLMDRVTESAAKRAEGYQHRIPDPKKKLSLIDRIKQLFTGG